MSWRSALRVPLETDLVGFIGLLRHHGIIHRVTEESGEQVLWVFGVAQSEQVQALYQEYLSGQWTEESIVQPPTPRSTHFQNPGFVEQLRRSPLTALVIASCLLVALILSWAITSRLFVGLPLMTFGSKGNIYILCL